MTRDPAVVVEWKVRGLPSIRLSDAIEMYLAFRKTGNAKNTVRNDRKALDWLLKANGNIYLHNITGQHIERFAVEAAVTNSPSSLAIYTSCQSSFFKWARTRRFMKRDQDPLDGVRYKRHRRQHLYVPGERFAEVLEVADRHHPRDRALMAMFIYTLRRLGEVTSVKIGDVDLASRQIYMYNHKLKRPVPTPIPAVLDLELRHWLTWYADHAGKLESNWFLIPAKDPPRHFLEHGRWVCQDKRNAKLKPLKSCYKSVSGVVRAVLEDMGIATFDNEGNPKWVGGHTWRRSGASALTDATGDIRNAMAALDHSQQSTTEIYLDREVDRERYRNLVAGKPMYPVDDVVLGNTVDLAKERERRAAGES